MADVYEHYHPCVDSAEIAPRALVLGVFVFLGEAMATYDMKHSLICKLPNPIVGGDKLTTVCSMTNNNEALYILKSCGKTDKIYPMCIYKVDKFNTKPVVSKINVTKNGKVAKIAKHANGIAFANNALFVITMNTSSSGKPQLLKINLDGEIKKEIFYKKNGIVSECSSIAYIGKDKNDKLKFVLGVQNSADTYFYDVAILKGTTLEYSGISFACMKGFNEIPNDIYYMNGYLFATYFKENDGQIKQSSIYKYFIRTVTNGSTLKPITVFVDKAKSTETKYEIEGLVIYNGIKYVACNRSSTVDADNKDGVFRQEKK